MMKQALPKEFFDSKNGLTYVLNGDYYIPMFAVPWDDRPIGKYGRMRMQYLKEQHPGKYSSLILSGKLHEHLVEVNECCTRMKQMLVAETAKKQGVTEKLKAKDQLAWVQKITTS